MGPPGRPAELTALLVRWSDGDEAAFERLVALAYDDLRAIAHRRLRSSDGSGLATTALVHEAYLRLVGHSGHHWDNRARFFAFVSKAMRHILVDHARAAAAERRGGGAVHLGLDQVSPADAGPGPEVLDVHAAIEQLTTRHPRMARVVELRFFGGFSMPEVAEVLDVSVRTVEREWTRARAYLLDSLGQHDG